MKINNKNIKHYHMKINSFTYQPMIYNREIFQPESSIRPILGKAVLAPKSMELIAEFHSKLDISNFIADLMKNNEIIIDIDDGYKYRCYLSQVGNLVEEYWQGWYRITLPLLVIQQGSRRRLLLDKRENHVIIAGNWPSECIYEITPYKNMYSFEIDGHVIRNLYENKTVYFDGEQKKIYTNTEINKYPDCTLKNNSFPIISPDTNVIKMSDTDVKVYLYYDPIFI